ncbi:MAG: glycosyltransferase [Microgenomates group bacterium]
MNAKKYTPLLSIIIPTLNNERDMPVLMKSISAQTYPKNRIELLVLDGGSKDKTTQIAKKYRAKVFHNKDVMAEPGVNLGMEKAKGDLMMILAVDNIYEDKRAFEKIVSVFEDPSIFAAFPKHDSNKSDNLFTTYHNTFTDPFNHFVYGDSANGRTFSRVYKTITSNDIYDVYDYNSNPMPPMIAFAQGITVRGSYRRSKQDAFDDISPIIKLIKSKKKIAFVHSVSLMHHTTRDIHHFIRKQRWATHNAISKTDYGISYRTNFIPKKNQTRMKLWPVYAFSIIGPIAVSFFGLIRDKNMIWLFHPIAALVSASASAVEVLVYTVKKQSRISRQ